MRISFRVNVDPDTGYGHIFRCLNIASKLKHAGHETIFICNENDLVQNEYCHFVNYEVGSALEINQTADILKEISPDALILDIFPEEKRPKADYPALLRFKGKTISFVDSDDDFKPEDSIIVNANPGYKVSCSQDNCFKGLDFFMLNPDFHREKFPQKGTFISLGSVDENNDLPWILNALHSQGERVFNILASPYASYAHKREKIFSAFTDSTITWHKKITSAKLNQLMNEAKLCVTNGGNVMLEMMFFHKPIVVIPSNPRLAKLANWCAEHKGILLCNNRNEFVLKCISAKDFKPESLVDGKGIDRVLNLLLS